MVAILGMMMCGSPLLLIVAVILTMGFAIDAAAGSARICLIVVILQLLAAATVGGVYRWCFERPAVRSAALLVSLLGSLLLLSDQMIIAGLATSMTTSVNLETSARLAGTFAVNGATVVGIACSVCIIAVSIVELPMRWVHGDSKLVSDGTFRVFRALGLMLLVIVCSTVLQRDGGAMLIQLIIQALG